jgi:diguanylate cyclase (GGDEF)-like protein
MSTSKLQILAVGAAPGGLVLPDSWQITLCATPDAAVAELATQTFDAVLLQAADAAAGQALEYWPALSQAVQDAAVLALLEPDDAELALRLVQRGVQDVLSSTEAAAGGVLTRRVELAVARKRLDELQRKGGSIDLATGLPTRQQWLDHLAQLCALREREPAAMAVVVLRIDGLATAEARLGATAARSLQRKVAVRLRSSLRASDLVGTLGSDAYAVLLSWLDSPAASDLVAAKLVAALQRPYSVAGEQLTIAVAAGLARHGEHGRDAQTLLRVAHAEAASFVALGRAGYSNLAERGSAPAANDD